MHIKSFKSRLLMLTLILIGLLVTNGCMQDFNQGPYHTITAQVHNFSEDDLGKAIGPVYVDIRLLFSGWRSAFTQEIGTDELAQPANASGWSDGGQYLRLERHTWKATDPAIASLWHRLYQGVINANRIIGGLKDGQIKVPENISKKQLFLR